MVELHDIKRKKQREENKTRIQDFLNRLAAQRGLKPVVLGTENLDTVTPTEDPHAPILRGDPLYETPLQAIGYENNKKR